ncbi:MAG: RagB/SusD family nutrient uptake outer membrane protein [Bacteroidales bacterium]|nr:RagB/SusD family nutrient uptake outer membrane protein [Bacteroidales bacterium]
MKKIFTIISLFSVLALSSCADYLDRKNLDSFDDQNFWSTEQSMRLFAQGTYTAYLVGYSNAWSWGRYFTSGGAADEFYNTSIWTTTTATSGNGWTFSYVRRHNLMIARADLLPVSDEAKNHWKGVGRFFRAMEYADLVWSFGDVPFYDTEIYPSDPIEVLYKERQPAAEVCLKIMEDYEFAANNVRLNDGANQVNRYLVLGMMSRELLELGTMLKYHGKDQNGAANTLLEKSKWAAEQLIASGKFAVVDDYRGIFSSEDLSTNKEVIFYRQYKKDIVTHSLVTYSSAMFGESQSGVTLKALNNWLCVDGLPIKQSPVYDYDKDNNIRYYEEMYANRDPRLYATLNDEMRIGGIHNSPASTGICVSKFTPYSFTDSKEYSSDYNSTDAPIIRYGEVLLNYAEACAELGQFTQAVADQTINVLRNRNIKKDNEGEVLPKLPKMVINGGNVTANGVVVNDPDRDPSVDPILWEIRRERAVELFMEGHRRFDLKRWKKFSYIANNEIDGKPRDIVIGSYFNYGALTDDQKADLLSKVPEAYLYRPIEGDDSYVALNPIVSQLNRREWVEGDIIYERQYFTSVPKDQIKLYKDNGVTLTQNPGWDAE